MSFPGAALPPALSSEDGSLSRAARGRPVHHCDLPVSVCALVDAAGRQASGAAWYPLLICDPVLRARHQRQRHVGRSHWARRCQHPKRRTLNWDSRSRRYQLRSEWAVRGRELLVLAFPAVWKAHPGRVKQPRRRGQPISNPDCPKWNSAPCCRLCGGQTCIRRRNYAEAFSYELLKAWGRDMEHWVGSRQISTSTPAAIKMALASQSACKNLKSSGNLRPIEQQRQTYDPARFSLFRTLRTLRPLR
jgi:hypothetical protein